MRETRHSLRFSSTNANQNSEKMRPINKNPPAGPFADYDDAHEPLVERLGKYCSYCERWMPSGLAVEHKRPKNRHPAQRVSWSNFLLSCPNCNSGKGSKRVTLRRYFWPDTDNTFRALVYDDEGFVRASKKLPKRLRRTAQRTIQLLGLNRHHGKRRKPARRDDRWSDRRSAWQKADLLRRQLETHDTPDQRNRIIVMAQERGMVSVWLAVFRDHSQIKVQLLQAFRGTDLASFDPNGTAVPRLGGQI
jgi:uncharacterized protein (TIGR02646 family)